MNDQLSQNVDKEKYQYFLGFFHFQKMFPKPSF